MKRYRVRVIVEKVRGYCAAYYKPGDSLEIERFYIKSHQQIKICLHALSSMMSLLMPFLKGASARDLGIGIEDDVGYLQCPDPGEPYTNGGTVVFKLIREEIAE